MPVSIFSISLSICKINIAFEIEELVHRSSTANYKIDGLSEFAVAYRSIPAS